MTDHGPLLRTLGERVRGLRLQRGWTLRDVAGRSGLSVRFLIQLERGVGNISVGRLADVADAFGTSLATLFADAEARARPLIVALLGLRGAGKTTVGQQLARRLGCGFVELDQRIEQAANLSLAEIFALHGERYYRRLELEAVRALLAEPSEMVLATGGGIVTSPDTYALIRSSAVTVWLRASAARHWTRVLRQGDRRPMRDHPQAMEDLRALLAEREPLYSQASIVVDTTALAVGRTVEAVTAALQRHAAGRQSARGKGLSGTN